MNTFQTLFVLAACLSFAQSMDHKSVLQFGNMILCVLPHSDPIGQFANYGCYCGFGGSGKPVDALDRCCQIHDHCYSVAQDHGCEPYFTDYNFKCYKPWRQLTCLDTCNSCERFLCECDRAAACCFGRSHWYPEHYNLPQNLCH
ncbi:Basic phospholipase A2 beta-bungarotoxin A1 chain [Collichthys lucidus]|uniref:Phospholipase A2 n=1 Tax=Collichthys lucidus TaxID=240159 RepID=A0A4U5V9R2_COLLU|nr:Basic phospholipase A2 beta-bungarotoxin A1 chain [Collichthys lucidus]